jgi:anti-sigma-K factor RskA
MKKIFLIFALSLGVLFSSNAQLTTGALQNAAQKASTTAKTAGFDVNSLSSSIMSKLTTSLALTSAQNPKITEAVTSFLKQKSGILSLATTDKTKYASKLGELTTGLTTKLKGTLTASQFTKYLSLKPTTNSASNVLSQLFY